MKDTLFRPKLLSEVEMCDICGRPVGMVFDDRGFKNRYPFMCFVCDLRFPAEQWEEDEQGLFFNLSKNGGIDMVPDPVNGGGSYEPWLKKSFETPKRRLKKEQVEKQSVDIMKKCRKCHRPNH